MRTFRSEECPCSCQGRPIRANCQAGDTLFEVTGTVTSAQSTFPVFEDNVIELNLGNNVIEEIKEDYFNNATIPLAELKLFNCSISTVNDNAFRNFFTSHLIGRLESPFLFVVLCLFENNTQQAIQFENPLYDEK